MRKLKNVFAYHRRFMPRQAGAMRAWFQGGPSISGLTLVSAASFMNAAIYHAPLLSFASARLSGGPLDNLVVLSTLFMLVSVMTTMGLALIGLVSSRLLKPVCMLAACLNALALYFIKTYGILLDKSMMGNVLNTNYQEASVLWHPTLFLYLLVFGAGPCLVLAWVRIRPSRRLRMTGFAVVTTVAGAIWLYATASSWLWIDKHAKSLGGLILPWSYTINLTRYQASQWATERRASPLPAASFIDQDKTVVVLVIGESSRARNYALYGYERSTNPSLSAMGAVPLANAQSCATYTTEALLCILSHDDPSLRLAGSVELLPSYLDRHGVDVMWRTNNWGEPPLHIRSYERASDLTQQCNGPACSHDGLLLTNLKQRIASSEAKKILVVLHLGGSHGPSYASKYPPTFEVFKPVCQSVELRECSKESLINAYDNSILFTDYVVGNAIAVLKEMPSISSTLLYVSDHGESLGEHGLYLHGTPMALAPDVQKEVPFVAWMSPAFQRLHQLDEHHLRERSRHSQSNVFHSVMGALGMRSDIYAPDLNIFSAPMMPRSSP